MSRRRRKPPALQWEDVTDADVALTMVTAGTRQRKVEQVRKFIQHFGGGRARVALDGTWTVIDCGGHVGVARRHVQEDGRNDPVGVALAAMRMVRGAAGCVAAG